MKTDNKYMLNPTIILLLTGLYACSMFISNFKIQLIWFIITVVIQILLLIQLLWRDKNES